MKIVEIAPYKGKLFAVRLDDGQTLWLHSDLIRSECLYVGGLLDEAAIAGLQYRAAVHRAYEYGLYLLERRSYSYKELYKKLMEAKHAQEDAVLEALEKLVYYGFLNDARYAQSLARQYVEGKCYGLRRAAYEMRHKGLSQEDIDDALEPYNDPELVSRQLLTLLQKKYARQLTDLDDRKAVERVTASLMRRGYDYRQIRFALEDYEAALEEE